MSLNNFDEEKISQPVNFNNCLQPARPIAPHELPRSLQVSGLAALRILDAIGQSEKKILDTKD